MALRGRQSGVREYRLALDSSPGPERYRAADVQQLSYEVFYTDLICGQLSQGEYDLLLQTLPDLVNPGTVPPFQFPVQNIALFNVLRKFENEFFAMERVIRLVGTQRQKTDALTYMNARNIFMAKFPATQPPLPPPPAPPPAAFLAAIQQAIQGIQATLGGVGASFQDLTKTAANLAATIEGISASGILGNLEDDKAFELTDTLFAENRLTFLPTVYKVELIHRILGGSDIVSAVEDEEEQAILTIFQDAKKRSPAEFLQVACSAGWETLDSSINGTEHNRLEGLFKF
ncbi:hypothetical protein EDD91_7594 [Streptomyces sp. KS 21]|nr:hypothetical protein EDD91_7594 [Streptomyces sp. KS 21]